FAINATKTARKVHEENLRQRAHKEAQLKDAAAELAEKLKEVSITIGAKTSTKGKIFGSVNTIQIAEELARQGFEIDRKNVTIKEELIKEVGKYTATVKLHREVEVEIPFEIISE
ncbi:MAG: 50S ribosomal protein L9, partial [Bacteroidales bacterium]|nr:50S ribosomal protein L9 [Bacteroidales bacterium]